MVNLFAAVVLTSIVGAGPFEIDRDTGRENLLAEPRPYPAQRVDSPDRLENGRLWVSRYPVGSRTPIPEQVYEDPGAAHYGAAPSENHRIAYMRVGHQIIAFDPYATYHENGFEKFRAAKNQWLREHGYVLKVRTHVNARYLHEPGDQRAELPQPRATIRIHREETKPRQLEAAAPSWNPVSYDEWRARQIADAPRPAEETEEAGADTPRALALGADASAPEDASD